MSGMDFIDDDLVRQREAAKRVKLGPGDEPAVPLEQAPPDEVPVRPISDFNLTRMARHKQELDEKTAQSMQELDRLRQRQKEIEQEKRDLEEQRRKQEEYERGKRELIERFSQSLVTLEKEEIQAERLTELLAATRKRFKLMLAELQEINEESWPVEAFREQLSRALSIVENARAEYNKSMARLEAIQGEKAPAAERTPLVFERPHPITPEERSFGQWVKIGLALSLPLLAMLVALVIALVLLRSFALI